MEVQRPGHLAQSRPALTGRLAPELPMGCSLSRLLSGLHCGQLLPLPTAASCPPPQVLTGHFPRNILSNHDMSESSWETQSRTCRSVSQGVSISPRWIRVYC